MRVLEFPQTLPDKIDYLLQPVVTRPAEPESLSESQIAAWQELIDSRLASWAMNPEQLGGDALESPSAEIILQSASIANVLRAQNFEAPDRVVANGDGGIVFRWRSGELTWSLELDSDGSLESSIMEHDSLVCRHSLHSEPSR